MRDAVAQAKQAGTIAGQTAGQYGATAAGIGANLLPYETRQLINPSGMSQRDIGAQLTAGMGATGGTTSAIQGAAAKNAGVTRNPMGFSAALDEAARLRDKANAGTAEGVAAKNVDVKLGQQNDASKELGSLYGTNVGAQLGAQRNQAADIEAETAANKTGWLQNLNDTIAAITGAARAYKGAGG